MPQATFSVRMDSSLKDSFEALCNDFGMNMSTAINVFARAVVRERRVPFEISSPYPAVTREKTMQTFKAIREQSAKNFPVELSLEEINGEISNSRARRTDK